MWSTEFVFATGISAPFSMDAYFQAVCSKIQHEMQRRSPSLASLLQTHTKALPTGSSLHVWFTHVSSPNRVKQLLESSDCSCSAQVSGSHVGGSVAAAENPEDSLPAACHDTT